MFQFDIVFEKLLKIGGSKTTTNYLALPFVEATIAKGDTINMAEGHQAAMQAHQACHH